MRTDKHAAPPCDADGDKARLEGNILLVYSVYTLVMAVVSWRVGWANWVIPVILTGMAVGWGVFLRRYQDYRFRAFFVSALALVNFLIYGIYAKNFFGILSTMAALVILLAIYGIPEILWMSTGVSVFLLFYHAVIAKTIRLPSSALDRSRMLLQILSIFTIEGITYYLVKAQLSANDKLLETIEALKQAEKSKDDFMANVSHEIRTPINTVCGISEMIQMETLSDTVREDVQNIQMAGRSLLSTVSDILDFSELQSGKLTLTEEPYNITSTVNDVLNTAIAQCQGKELALIVDCDARLPQSLLGDEQKLRRVILNLVNNAIKFTERGCVTITVTSRKEEYGINLIVRVQDTGIGIPDENMENLFHTYNQVDTARNRAAGGIGLGLAISQVIVRKMGGFLSAESVYGKGTEVRFAVPQKVLEDAPIITVRKPEQVRVLWYMEPEKYDPAVRESYAQMLRHTFGQVGVFYRSCRSHAELKRCLSAAEAYTHLFLSWEEYSAAPQTFDALADRLHVVLMATHAEVPQPPQRLQMLYKPFYAISVAAVLNGDVMPQGVEGSRSLLCRFTAPEACVLVVDDNLMNLKVVEGLLRPYKIKVQTAASGREALEKLNVLDCDFVFMDHMMPEMDGVEVLHRIRKKAGHSFQTLPVIALTANAIGGAREMFLNEGFADFVAKPIDPAALERVLRKFIPESKLIREGEGATPAHEPLQSAAPQPAAPAAPLSLPGIDVAMGITYCGGTLEDYLEIVRLYAALGEQKLGDLDRFYTAQDWKNYTILVHALKSTSLGIGAVALSEQARALEEAGKAGNAEVIKAEHAPMLAEYRRVLAALAAEPRCAPQPAATAEAQTAPTLPPEKVAALLHSLAERLAAFESDGVPELLHTLAPCAYRGRPLGAWCAGVETQVQAFDFIGAAESLTKLLAEGEEGSC